MPRLTSIVKILLIINIAVFLLGSMLPDNIIVHSDGRLEKFQGDPALLNNAGIDLLTIDVLDKWFSVFPRTFTWVLQVWRFVTYQFLHAGFFHILFNMLGLYFLGPTLERHFGPKRFLFFYLLCGVVGAVFYTILALVGYLHIGPMVGASGAILGMLAACAILFPQFIVFFMFFPVPIRVASIILIVIYVANLLSKGTNAGGDAAHLAGMAAGAIYVLWTPLTSKISAKTLSRHRNKFINDQLVLQREVDRILQKVSEKGIHSLTLSEKRILKKASRSQHQNHP